jgi:hypothetical protein
MALEKELQLYKDKLSELIKDEGKYVLIHDSSIIDTFSSYEDAIKEGYKLFKLEPFLVKQIQSIEHIQFISRLRSSPYPIPCRVPWPSRTGASCCRAAWQLPSMPPLF